MARQPVSLGEAFRVETPDEQGFTWELTNQSPSVFGLARDEGTMAYDHINRRIHQKIGPGDFDWTNGSPFGVTTPYFDFKETFVPIANNTTTPYKMVDFDTNLPFDSNYKVDFAITWSMSDTANDIIIKLNSGTTNILTYQIEPQDSGGSGDTVQLLDGPGTINTGTNQRYPLNGSFVLENQLTGPKNLNIEFELSNSGGGRVSAVYFAYLGIGEVSNG